MSDLVVVAIPAKDDYVWKISSEKVPHMTLLYLGDAKMTTSMVDYTKHVVDTVMCRFGMDVIRRGELGDKNADVLFFGKYGIQKLLDFRSYLLVNPDFSRAFNSTAQHPEFTPHLTLGYPETPAKPDNRDYPGISWVNFDRIAIWNDDYEGPEFELDEKYDRALAYADRGAAFLEHYGIKGMQWGVRRSKKQLAKGRTKSSADHEKVAKLTKNKKHTLSNDELATVIKRKDLESRYSQMNPSKLKRGENVVKAVVGTVGTVSSVVALASSPAGKAGVAAAKKALSSGVVKTAVKTVINIVK